MLKSTFNTATPSDPKHPTLPHLFRHLYHGSVVLFFDEHEGTQVVLGKMGNSLCHRRIWASCWDSVCWTPLKPGESITITVEED